MSATAKRYLEVGTAQFRRVLAGWLAGLPAGGWEGGVADLEAELVRAARRGRVPAVVPRRSGLGRRMAAEAAFVCGCGFVIECRRTKRERTLRFTPAGGRSGR